MLACADHRDWLVGKQQKVGHGLDVFKIATHHSPLTKKQCTDLQARTNRLCLQRGPLPDGIPTNSDRSLNELPAEAKLKQSILTGGQEKLVYFGELDRHSCITRALPIPYVVRLLQRRFSTLPYRLDHLLFTTTPYYNLGWPPIPCCLAIQQLSWIVYRPCAVSGFRAITH